MSREPLVFFSPEPAPSEPDDQEGDCTDGACALPSRLDSEPVAIRDTHEG